MYIRDASVKVAWLLPSSREDMSLWTKLLSYNINGKILRVVYNIYEKAKACVKSNNIISHSFNCNIGVLFSLFINDVKGFLANRYNCLSGLSSLIRDNLDIDLESYIKLYVLLYVHM